MLSNIDLRAVTQADLPFLFQLYVSTRDAELAGLTWPAEQKQAFLRMQFDAQHRHYMAHYAHNRFHVVMHFGVPVGRFYVADTLQAPHLIDISLLPSHRGRGIGTILLGELLLQAAMQGQRVTLNVEAGNPAIRLYQRLGFAADGEAPPYRRMVWLPSKRTAVNP